MEFALREHDGWDLHWDTCASGAGNLKKSRWNFKVSAADKSAKAAQNLLTMDVRRLDMVFHSQHVDNMIVVSRPGGLGGSQPITDVG